MSAIEVTAEVLPAPAETSRGRASTRLMKNRNLRLGVGILVAMIALGIATRIFLPDPNTQDLSAAYASPGTPGHLLGTDPLGRDVLAWIGGGIGLALLIGLSVALIAAAIGTTVGLVAGYFGGAADTGLMRLVDLQLAVPPLLLFIAASTVITPTVISVILLLGCVAWVPYARMVRARILSERERSYVAAARLAGSGRTSILVKHLLPAASTPVIVLLSLQAGYVLLWESALSFVGVGITPPSTSLGYMIAAGRDHLVDAWWIATFPGVAIVLMVLAFNLIGDGLRDAVHVDEGGDR